MLWTDVKCFRWESSYLAEPEPSSIGKRLELAAYWFWFLFINSGEGVSTLTEKSDGGALPWSKTCPSMAASACWLVSGSGLKFLGSLNKLEATTADERPWLKSTICSSTSNGSWCVVVITASSFSSGTMTLGLFRGVAASFTKDSNNLSASGATSSLS